nr:MAG: putative RNA-dependent RNA polymerase [Mitoviridae sp.]
MYIILILITLFLANVHAMNLEWLLVLLVGLPAWAYQVFLLFLLVIRLGTWAYQYAYLFRAFRRRLRQWIDDEDPFKGSGTSSGASSKKNGQQTRSFSTSSRQSPKERAKLQEKILIKNRVSSGVSFTKAKINATFGLKAKGLLLGVFLRMLLPIGLSKTSARAKTILTFIRYCSSIHKAQGMKGLVNYLKASQVLFQQCLGGFRLLDTTELKCRVARNRYGLPRIINGQDRALIRAGNWRVAKFYMTLFALYRILEFPGTLKLKTITDGFKGHMETGGLYHRIVAYAPTFAKMLLSLARDNKVKPLELRGVSPRPIVKSAPGTGLDMISTTPWVLVSQAFNLKRLGLGDCIEYFLKYFQAGTKVPFPGLLAIWQGAVTIPLGLIPSLRHAIGKLGFKDEPAGKVRVFAMADAWTQWVLEPFHQYLFDILRLIEMDGTFDQLKPVKAKAATAKAAYSLDLSAATDRLPITIQWALFKSLISQEFATQWMRLLVGRGYYAFSNKYNVAEMLHYAVGQPMGALSSWASLAVTHHFLVQVAAWEAGVVPVGTWFTDYAVLGDDLVIFDSKVKVLYLKVVDAIGVECGIAKSLLSPRGTAIEFAKRTFWLGKDISPVPLLEFISANLTLSDAISFARKYSMSFPLLLRSLGYGYRVVGSLNQHVGKLNSRVRTLLFAYYLPLDEEGVQELFSRGNPLLSVAQLKEVVLEFKKYLEEDYTKLISNRLKVLPNPAELIKSEADRALNTLLNRFYFAGFLETFIDKVLPGAGSAEAIQTEVLPDEFNPLLGTFNRPMFAIPTEAKAPVLQVPPYLYNRLENLLRLWRLSFERIVKILVVESMANFRQDAVKLLWQIKGITYDRTLVNVYTSILATHRAISAAGTGKVPLFREQEKLRWGTDPVQMKFWIDFSKCIQRVLRRTRGSDSPTKG